MSSPPTIEPFKGTNWKECDDFIRAIRAAAWKEGKIRDSGWMADFASLHFSRKALSWYARLPQDIREDWAKLQVALLDQWAPLADYDEPGVEPTPAAAPSGRSDKSNRTRQGVLKVVIDGTNIDYYLEIGREGRGVVTNDASRALRIRCNSLSNATLLERIDGSRHSWLGVQWGSQNPDLKNGSTNYAYLVLLDSLTLQTSWSLENPYQLASCTLSTNGEVTPAWVNKDTKIKIGIFRHRSGMLCVAVDPDAYSKRYPREKRVKLFFEPID